jgi:hypothetical protein
MEVLALDQLMSQEQWNRMIVISLSFDQAI